MKNIDKIDDIKRMFIINVNGILTNLLININGVENSPIELIKPGTPMGMLLTITYPEYTEGQVK